MQNPNKANVNVTPNEFLKYVNPLLPYNDEGRQYIPDYLKPVQSYLEGIVGEERKSKAAGLHNHRAQDTGWRAERARARYSGTEMARKEKTELIFNDDVQREYPAYFPINLGWMYTIKLTDFLSYLDSIRETPVLTTSLNIIVNQMRNANYGVYEISNPNKKLTDQQLIDAGLGFFRPKNIINFIKDAINQYYGTGAVHVTNTENYLTYGQDTYGFEILPAQYMTPVFGDGRDERFGTLTRWDYRSGIGDQQVVNIPEREVISCRRFNNARLPIMGLGMIESNRTYVQQMMDCNNLLGHAVQNSLIPTNVVKAAAEIQADPKDVERFRKQLNSRYGGAKNIFRTLFLPSGYVYEAVPTNLPYEAILAVYEMLETRIMSAFGIPPALRPIQQEKVTIWKNTQANMQTFQNQVINAIWEDFSTNVFNEILERAGMSRYFTFKYQLNVPPNTDDVINLIKEGVITREEGRDILGYDFDEDNSEVYGTPMILNTYMPLKNAQQIAPQPPSPKPAVTPAPEAKELPKAEPIQALPTGGVVPVGGPQQISARPETVTKQKQLPEPSKKIKWKQMERKDDWRGKQKGGYKTSPHITNGNMNEVKDKIAADIKRLQTATEQKHLTGATMKYKAFLMDQVHRMLTALNTKAHEYNELVEKYKKTENKVKAADSKGNKRQDIKKFVAGVFNPKEELDKLDQLNSDTAKVAGADQLDNMQNTFSIKVDPDAAKNIADHVETASSDYLKDMNETTRQDLEDYLVDSVTDGATLDEVTAGIKDNFENINQNRAETIARNEIHRACDETNKQFYKESGVVEEVDVVGCQDDEGDCNRTGVPIDEIDDLDFHVNHTGIIVPSKYIDVTADDKDELPEGVEEE